MKKRQRFQTRAEWERADWSKTADELAKELGVGPQLVRNWARKIGVSYASAKRGPKPKINWEGADWSLSNRALADKLGVTREWVAQMRARMDV